MGRCKTAIFGYDEGVMRTLASICLALLLAISFGGSAPASAAAASAKTATPCAEMGMAGMPMPGKAPAAPHKMAGEGCALSCSIGCAVPPEALTSPIGRPIAWTAAFGRPAAGRKLASVAPEAQHPPPRTLRF